MNVTDPLPGLTGEARARHVAEMFARISHRYDLMNTLMTGGTHHRWRHLAIRLATQGIGGLALDVATGTGDMAIALTKRPGIRRVVGVDFVPEMLRLAQQKAQRRAASSALGFLQGDALALPFSNNTFVCATCGLGLRNVGNVPKALAEMTRVVQPGGRVVILEIVASDGNGPLQRLSGLYFHRVIPILGRILAGEREAYSYLPKSVYAFPLATELVQLMEETGLQNVYYRTVGMGLLSIHVGEKA